jgi:hypothetical protein
MFTKTSIALAFIVAISSGALAAQKKAPRGAFSSNALAAQKQAPGGAFSSNALAAQKQAPRGAFFSSARNCGQMATWDQNALRCDGAN